MKKSDCKDLERQIAELRKDHEKLIAAEQEMRKTTLYLQGILETTADGIIVVDNDSRIVLTSKRLLKNLGILESQQEITSMEQIIGIVNPYLVDTEEFLKRLTQINLGNEHIHDTICLKNGIIIEYYTRPLLIDGQKHGRVWSYRNISEITSAREALYESEQRARSLIDSSPLGVHIYKFSDAGELILVGANRAADEITGINTSNLFGKTIEEAFPYLAHSEVPERYKRAAREGESWSKTDLYYEDKQIKGAFDIQAFQISQGQMAVFFQDITTRKQTEMMLQLSEEKYRKIFQNIQDVYIEIAPDMTIQELSPSISRISLYTRNELIGQNLNAVSEDDTLIRRFISRLLDEGLIKDEDISLKDKDGKIIHCSVNLRMEKDENGKPVKVIGSLRDITDRKLAREEVLKLSRALEQSPSLIFIINTSAKTEYINSKVTSATGYTREELIGPSPSILKSGEQPDELYKELWQSINQGKEWKGEFHIRRKDGTTFWAHSSISPIRNNKGVVTNYIIISEDITDRKEIENELKKAKDKAEESDRLKSAFLTNISHEIRTPMNAILGFSDLLQNEDISPADMQQYIRLINSKGKELMGIISDVIDLSRIEAGDMNLHIMPIEINSFLEKIISSFTEEKAIEPKAQLSISHNFPEPVSPICMSDRNRLSQVLNNLLSNAYKFTEEGFIELGYRLKDGQVIFYVMDTGIGIPEDKIHIIFERFRQADDSITRKYGGTGLGLSISKQIVELLGGKLWVESLPGQGSTFYFTLPVSRITIPKIKEIQSPAPVRERQEMNLSGRKIIITEDDNDNYLYLESIIKKTGAMLVWAKDGQAAVDSYLQHPDADLIIMDIRMPVKDGLQATSEIREHDEKIPIIALTAFAFTEDRDKSLAAGCNDYVPKPVRPQEVINLLRKYLGSKAERGSG